MLRHSFNLSKESKIIEEAVSAAFENRFYTCDLEQGTAKNTISTQTFTEQLLKYINSI